MAIGMAFCLDIGETQSHDNTGEKKKYDLNLDCIVFQKETHRWHEAAQSVVN